MFWPSAAEYNEVLQTPQVALADPQLRGGSPTLNALGLPVAYSGNFSCVYRINDPQSNQSWAVKLFSRSLPNLAERYAKIIQHLRDVQLPFLVDCEYLEQGIQVRGTWYPLLKMPWVEGRQLNEFIEEYLDHPKVLKMLAQAWWRLAHKLRETNIVHGDLQASNVLVSTKPGSFSLRLIDYDGMVVPGLDGQKSMECGHPNFQHPRRLQDGAFEARADCFSNLVIFTALRALMVGGRTLWERFNNEENLVFRGQDFEKPGDSELIRLLWQGKDAEVSSLVGHLMLAAQAPLEHCPFLDDLPGDRVGTIQCPIQDDLLGDRVGTIRPLSADQRTTVERILGQDRPAILDENVQFTVYRPRAVQPEKWYTMLAFAHLSERPIDAPADERDPIMEVLKRAEKVLDHIEAYQPVTQDSLQAVPREGEITLLPEIAGITFNPPLRVFLWQETVHQEEFRLKASAGLDGTIARGRLSVFLGSILLADVPLAIRVAHDEESAKKPPMEASAAKPYRKIFASYSHKDSAIVQQFERYAKVFGDEYLRDWVHLRAGEVWDERLKELINEADVFQLFWSRNSMTSRFVRQEWEHALSLNRMHFIRPTYWEEPLPASPKDKLPPEELLRLHFQRITLGGQPGQESAGEHLGFDEPKPMLGETQAPIKYHCPRCKAPLEALTSEAGTKKPCPACGQRLQVPAPLAPAPAAAPPNLNKTMLAGDESRTASCPPVPAGDAARPPPPPSGQVGPDVPGYAIEGVLGQGGMGVVYWARHLSTGRDVALKLIPSPGLESAPRLRAEANLIGLTHPNILPIRDVFVRGDQTVLAMELVQGGSLDKHLAEFVNDAKASARLLSQVARAIAFAHQKGIVHGDLKPGNILLRESKGIAAGLRTPLVADFGLARTAPSLAGQTRSEVIIGTPSYMAPERIMSNEATTAVDVYGLGAVLYELLTGRRPFQGMTPADTFIQVIQAEMQRPSAINPKVDRFLEAICLRCMDKDPSKRPSAQALADELERWLQGFPALARPMAKTILASEEPTVLARPLSRTERVLRKAKRQPIRAMAVALGILIALGLLIWGIILIGGY